MSLKQIATGLAVTLCLTVLLSPARAEVKSGKQRLEKVRKSIQTIDTDSLKKLLKERPDAVVVDVRTPQEINIRGGMIKAPLNQQAVNIPRGWLEFRIADSVSAKDTPIIVYCGTNRRSPLAARTLMDMGYTNVRNYPAGIFGWKKAGLPVSVPDKAPGTMLYSRPQKVTDGVWSAIGATQPSTYENAGHNNNLSFIVTGDGVLVVNAGGSYLLAKALHEEIKKVTDQPVKYVVLENGQGHAALGTGYWRERGVTVIAHEDAVLELEERAEQIMDSARRRLRDKLSGTRVVMPDKTFDDKMVIEMGGTRIELVEFGRAHSPGDIMVWLPAKSLIITGDMAFHKRLLPIFDDTDTVAWLESWEKFAALKAKILIPGHGGPTNMAEVTKYTKGYLIHMRKLIGKLIEDGGTLIDAYKVDQSPYAHLDTFKFLARQNAGRIFRAMEFE